MNYRLTAIILVIGLALASGCATSAQLRARQAMENSQAAYERCLQQNLDDPSQCEIFKRRYEADLEAYRRAEKNASPTVTGYMEIGPGGSKK